jgi:hypothetical protein
MKVYAQVRGSRDPNAGVEAKPVNQNRETQQSSGDNGPLLVVFFVTAVIYIVVSAMLVYHWQRFGKNDKNIQLVQGVYFAVSLLLLVVALFSII